MSKKLLEKPSVMAPGTPDMLDWATQSVFDALITGGTKQMRSQLQCVIVLAARSGAEWDAYRRQESRKASRLPAVKKEY